jgi:hypothetical protein
VTELLVVLAIVAFVASIPWVMYLNARLVAKHSPPPLPVPIKVTQLPPPRPPPRLP